MAEGELDLLERPPALVSELGEGTTQVVRRNLHSDPPAVGDDGLEHRLRPHRVVAHAAGLVDGPQHSAFGDAGGLGTPIEGRFGPGGHRDGADDARTTKGTAVDRRQRRDEAALALAVRRPSGLGVRQA